MEGQEVVHVAALVVALVEVAAVGEVVEEDIEVLEEDQYLVGSHLIQLIILLISKEMNLKNQVGQVFL